MVGSVVGVAVGKGVDVGAGVALGVGVETRVDEGEIAIEPASAVEGELEDVHAARSSMVVIIQMILIRVFNADS